MATASISAAVKVRIGGSDLIAWAWAPPGSASASMSGGTSAAALYQLEKGGLRTVLSKAVWAAYQRSVALGRVGEAASPMEVSLPGEDTQNS
ncbi:MAG: pyrroline-5-carboxylate reductase dimerization domain-containing protein [Erythrobacter cryptus]